MHFCIMQQHRSGKNVTHYEVEMEAKNTNSYTPLYNASKDSKKIKTLLFMKHKADIEARVKDGNTPFHLVGNSPTFIPPEDDEAPQYLLVDYDDSTTNI